MTAEAILLALILLLLIGNSVAFWYWWFRDYRTRQKDIEQVVRLMGAYRAARTAEDVGHLMNMEIIEGFRQGR